MTIAAATTRLASRSEIANLLSKPAWSVNDLFHTDSESRKIHQPPTEQSLEKLLKQSALESCQNDPERRKMLLKELTNQLVFVEHVANVDTKGLKPLVRIGGNSMAQEFTLDKVNSSNNNSSNQNQTWKPTDLASEKNGKFYVLHEGLRRE